MRQHATPTENARLSSRNSVQSYRHWLYGGLSWLTAPCAPWLGRSKPPARPLHCPLLLTDALMVHNGCRDGRRRRVAGSGRSRGGLGAACGACGGVAAFMGHSFLAWCMRWGPFEPYLPSWRALRAARLFWRKPVVQRRDLNPAEQDEFVLGWILSSRRFPTRPSSRIQSSSRG